MLVYVLFYLGQLSHFPACCGAGVTNLNEPPSSFLLPPHYCGFTHVLSFTSSQQQHNWIQHDAPPHQRHQVRNQGEGGSGDRTPPPRGTDTKNSMSLKNSIIDCAPIS